MSFPLVDRLAEIVSDVRIGDVARSIGLSGTFPLVSVLVNPVAATVLTATVLTLGFASVPEAHAHAAATPTSVPMSTAGSHTVGGGEDYARNIMFL